VLALLATIVPPLAKPASAQLMPNYSVGVADFVNESGVQGDLLARLATDAVVVEMSKSNRYDVSITRTLMKSKMDELGLHAPLTKLDLVRVGEALSADAMLEGSIKSVQISGSGPTRRASVTLAVQMIDEASGEIINGAVQTGTSSARVGYTPDDNTLITEAINSAAFLAVKTMVDYVIPEATVMMNIGQDEVMLNKGIRDGMKAGMRMIVLRDKEIIGYLDLRDVTPQDSTAKVVKSMRGIQPEDKARAIFEMPMVTSSLKSEPLPTGAPKTSSTSSGAAGKIGKFLVGAAIVFGLVSLFKGGRGNEDAPNIGTGGPMTITWDGKLYNYGKNVVELQILRDADASSTAAQPVKAIRDPSLWALGRADLTYLYNPANGPTPVTYYKMDNSASTYTEVNWTVPNEGWGTPHQYVARVLYQQQTGTGQNGPTYTYSFTKVSNYITATAIQPVSNTNMDPAYGDPLLVSELRQTGGSNLDWTYSPGADVYYVKVEPVEPNKGPIWQSDPIYYQTGTTVSLPDSMRLKLADALSHSAYIDSVMKWKVYARHQSDTSQAWVEGQESRFIIGGMPPGTPN